METITAFSGRISYNPDRDGACELTIVCASFGPRGRGARIRYRITDSSYGRMLIACTAGGVCWLAVGDSDDRMEAELRVDFREAAIERAPHGDFPASQTVDCVGNRGKIVELAVDIRATPFQAAVWRELCAIPRGTTRSYQEIARRIGKPDAARAVGHAVGSNPISIFIPCHRAVGSNGSLTGYRWGLAVKRRLLNDEGVDLATLEAGAAQPNLILSPPRQSAERSTRPTRLSAARAGRFRS